MIGNWVRPTQCQCIEDDPMKSRAKWSWACDQRAKPGNGPAIIPFGTSTHGHTWLHHDCWPEWNAHRQTRARQSLETYGIEQALGPNPERSNRTPIDGSTETP